MYVRVQIVQGTDGDALAVPQQAIQRNDAGGSEVYVVRTDNRAVLKPVRAGRVDNEEVLVLEGLVPGDRVVVEGFQKFQPGDVVEPISWQATQSAATTSAAGAEKAQPARLPYSNGR
jgi:membrane fusion protein (multidrug efflux system)